VILKRSNEDFESKRVDTFRGAISIISYTMPGADKETIKAIYEFT